MKQDASMTGELKDYQKALVEIRAVLEKYDLAGEVHVISKERAAFLTHFPSWSIVQFDQSTNKIRIKTTHLPTKAVKHKAAELGAHLVFQLRDLAAQSFQNMDKIAGVMSTHFEIQHTGFRDFDPETGL
jgi:hypothetical protein